MSAAAALAPAAPVRRIPITKTVMRDDQIAPKHRLLVEYMLHGLSHPSLCSRTLITTTIDTDEGPAALTRHPRVGEPLDLMQAAEVLRIKRRTARSLAKQPAFQRLLAGEVQAFREGHRAHAVRTMVEVMVDPGLGKAADRKVRLTAAAMVTGELGSGQGTTVNVNVGGTHINAGVVIDLRDDEPSEARTIEHEAA